jgi:hypothetical protein
MAERRRDELPIYTVYYNPADYPGKYVMRRFVITAKGECVADEKPICVVSALGRIHDWLPEGLVYIPRAESDDDVIIGSFL